MEKAIQELASKKWCGSTQHCGANNGDIIESIPQNGTGKLIRCSYCVDIGIPFVCPQSTATAFPKSRK